MSFCVVSELDRSSLTRLLLIAVLLFALMLTVSRARAQDGADGGSCYTPYCDAGNGDDGGPGQNGGNGGSSWGYPPGNAGNGGNGGAANVSGTIATAVGGSGGNGGDFTAGFNEDIGLAGNGGDATATASAIANGSNNAISSASATGGAGGTSLADGGPGSGGNATATSTAEATGSGDAISSASAIGGVAGTGTSGSPGNATATSSAVTAEGGIAQAQAQAQAGGITGYQESQSTAETTFAGVSVQSMAESRGYGLTDAIAQGGSGQSPINPGPFDSSAFSTALPDKAYATPLIGSASNVADALLRPDDTIFGSTILGGDGSSTFDFSFKGDLLLGVITDGGFDIIANGIDFPFEDAGDNSVINLGSTLGPNIDLTIEGEGVFAFGGAVPEPSTWALMLLGFAGLSFAGYRSAGRARD